MKREGIMQRKQMSSEEENKNTGKKSESKWMKELIR